MLGRHNWTPVSATLLVSVGIPQPYQHQADAIVRSLDGVDVVMESPTASGKTLAFTAPMLHSLVRNEGSHALMIYPMKALAFDQREQIRQVCEPLSVESWSYDGDTPEDVKKMLRDNRASHPADQPRIPEYVIPGLGGSMGKFLAKSAVCGHR